MLKCYVHKWHSIKKLSKEKIEQQQIINGDNLQILSGGLYYMCVYQSINVLVRTGQKEFFQLAQKAMYFVNYSHLFCFCYSKGIEGQKTYRKTDQRTCVIAMLQSCHDNNKDIIGSIVAKLFKYKLLLCLRKYVYLYFRLYS